MTLSTARFDRWISERRSGFQISGVIPKIIGVTRVNTEVLTVSLVTHQTTHMLGITIGNVAGNGQVMILFLAQPAQAVSIDQSGSRKRRLIRSAAMVGRSEY